MSLEKNHVRVSWTNEECRIDLLALRDREFENPVLDGAPRFHLSGQGKHFYWKGGGSKWGPHDVYPLDWKINRDSNGEVKKFNW